MTAQAAARAFVYGLVLGLAVSFMMGMLHPPFLSVLVQEYFFRRFVHSNTPADMEKYADRACSLYPLGFSESLRTAHNLDDMHQYTAIRTLNRSTLAAVFWADIAADALQEVAPDQRVTIVEELSLEARLCVLGMFPEARKLVNEQMRLHENAADELLRAIIPHSPTTERPEPAAERTPR